MASGGEELSRKREENERQLEVCTTYVVLKIPDVEQLGPQLQGGGATLKQDDPQTPHAKEEEEELWTTQEGDCLLGPEEADLTKFPLAGVSVKTEDHEDTPPESLQLHHSPHVQQLIGHQVERALQPQQGSSALKQEEQESLHVKEEEEEAWTARDGACFLGPEEADLTQLPLTGVPVWTEYYEDKPRLLPEAEHGDYTQETLSDDIDCEGDKRSHSDSKHTECSKKKTTEEKGRLASCAMAEQRPKKRTRKSQRFLDRYGERWPCLIVSRLPYHAFCTVCKTDIDISHQGATDCRRHVEGAKHKKFERALPFVPKITPPFSADPDLRTIRAETLFTNFIAEHNLPVAVADHAGPLFKKMFPDSQIAQHYGCARTKTTAILNTISSNDEQVITDLMCCFPFSIATDGSASDMDGVKLHPLVVRVYEPSVGKIAVVLLKVVECRDSTSEGIYNLMDQELNKRKIPWGNCVSFAADNASVMQGARRGVAAFIKSRNPHIYIVGCACHLMHTAAEKSSSSLSIDIEDMLIVIYYYLDKSSKRKALVRELQMLCDTDVRKILKLSSTKWLALGKCVQRLLQQWEPLTRFFAEEAAGKEEAKPPASSAHLSLKNAAAWKPSTLTSTSGKSSKFCLRKSKMGPSSTQRQAAPGALPKGVDHFMCLQKQMGENQKDLSEKAETTAVRKPQRVYAFLTDPQAKLYALFLKRAVPLFETANQILQKEEPCVHTLLQTLELQLQKLLLAFCKPECVVEMMEEVKGGHQPTLYQSSEHQLPDEELCIGHDTQIFIKSQGELPLGAFFRDVRKYFTVAVDYLLSSFPYGDELLHHAAVADISRRQTAKFSSLTYFIDRFPCLLGNGVTVDKVDDEFRLFQSTALDDDILTKRVDEAWVEIGAMESGGTKLFSNLSAVMLGVCVIFHSNADCERIFSLVTKNKTARRACLSTEVLSSLVTRKVMIASKGSACYKETFTDALLKKAKSATYNKFNKANV
ncbi:uncharacterized protein LOC129179195 isoform X2 [Dunckerocampus dactyliophorus]|uniref:uncharacterized protein LOC129179195 isoform X2 n=1 Tax=Dunckerocampus dactyliophorus TaxID=161453 RepID=UPI0024060E16|nr:uncharacterized protein LOC129179195 isoform X2 [Dunckerocampus dactyliophorus]